MTPCTAPFSPGARVIVPRFAHGHPAVGIIRRTFGGCVYEIETAAGERVTTLGLALQPAPENLALFRRRVVATQSEFPGAA